MTALPLHCSVMVILCNCDVKVSVEELEHAERRAACLEMELNSLRDRLAVQSTDCSSQTTPRLTTENALSDTG